MLLRKLKYLILLALVGSGNFTYGQIDTTLVEVFDIEDQSFSSVCNGPLPSRLIVGNITEHNYSSLESCIHSYYAALSNELLQEVVPADEAVRHIFRMISDLTLTPTNSTCSTPLLDKIISSCKCQFLRNSCSSNGRHY